ncbi:MAG: 30S ribosomal protein S6 [Candidatus Roizmanbacteria bacterium GW2011_GWA2_36_23]|uniref:Small ribosomal subunit protein bS6 n=1 Tax=Candidatus Roizmanbacteria bacterium GW2011_GWA2_36_23 TaxID=1618480 RepID=A0A0G0GPQ3_9BACT|nr:MAG: 30S ribosomal protein S6 [Candidatus Roizmanbacteria bacterium GW2011_GWA2_36_23]
MVYELTFLLNHEEELDNIKILVQSFSGKLETEEKWGKKSLAYPIKRNTSANFYHWVFEMEEKNIVEFRKKLNFNEKIIRYLLTLK